MTIWVEIKVQGGTPINDAAAEASEVSKRLGCAVHFTFNDVSCWAEPDGVSAEEFAQRWKLAFDAGGNHQTCTNRVIPTSPTAEGK
jgi:hypothetical protein